MNKEEKEFRKKWKSGKTHFFNPFTVLGMISLIGGALLLNHFNYLCCCLLIGIGITLILISIILEDA